MTYYRIPFECPRCGKHIVAVVLGVSAQWYLGINFECPQCKMEGGMEFDLTTLVKWAQSQDETVLN